MLRCHLFLTYINKSKTYYFYFKNINVTQIKVKRLSNVIYHIGIVCMIKHIPCFFSIKYNSTIIKGLMQRSNHIVDNTNFKASLSSLLIYSNGSSSDIAHNICTHPTNNSPQIRASQAIVR